MLLGEPRAVWTESTETGRKHWYQLKGEQKQGIQLILRRRGKAKSNTEIGLSVGRRRFSNLSALLHCFVTTEQMSVIIKLVVIRTTPACFNKVKTERTSS